MLTDKSATSPHTFCPSPLRKSRYTYLKNDSPGQTFRIVAIVIAIVCLGWSYWQSKRETQGAEGAK